METELVCCPYESTHKTDVPTEVTGEGRRPDLDPSKHSMQFAAGAEKRLTYSTSARPDLGPVRQEDDQAPQTVLRPACVLWHMYTMAPSQS